MALVLANRVQETTTTTGTGTITLAGAVAGFQSFAVVGNGNTTYYTITSGSAWEVGIGTYSTAGPTLARTTILSSSAGGAAITLAGTSAVFVTYPAEDSVYQDGATIAAGTAVLGVTNGGTGVTTSTGTGSVVLSASPTFTNTVSAANITATGTVNVSGGALNSSGAATVGLIATGTIIIGATTSANAITLGRSTVSQTTSIQAGATTSGNTKTINLGTGGLAGSTTTIAIGSTAGTSTTTLNGAVSFAGTIAAPLGSAAAPSYTFTGDTNTGIFSPGADTIAFSEGGVEAMRIASDGNVGIGTTSPGAKLDVSSSTFNIVASRSTGGYAAFQRFAASGQQAYDFYNINGVEAGRITVDGSNFMAFATNGSERMRITSAGNVGVGTTAPLARLFAETPTSTGAAIAYAANSNGAYPTGVFGGSFGYNFSAGGAEVDFWNGWTGAAGTQGGFAFRRQTGASSQNLLMTIQGDGNVGIGTATPVQRLHVRQDQDGTTAALIQNRNGSGTPISAVQFISGAFDLSDNRYAMISSAGGSNTRLQFWTGQGATPTEKMRITDAGNVGIGETSPGARLHVSGGTVGTTAGNLLNVTIDQGIAGTNAVGIRTNLVRVSSGTDWTTTAMRLQGRVDATDFGYIDLVSGGAQGLAFGSSTSERMRIDSSGNVGIGLSNPTDRLEVNGSSVFRGTALFNTSGSAGTNSAAYIRAANGLSSATTPDYTWWFNDQCGFFHPAANVIGFTTNGTERARVDASGNLLVGTTSATGRLTVQSAGSDVGYFDTTDTTGGPKVLAIRSIASSGTSTPALVIRQWRTSFAGSQNAGEIRFDGLTTTGNYAEFASIYATSGANSASGAPTAITFQTMNASYVTGERMRIDSAGNVGIGTTSPGAKLDVVGVSLTRTDSSGGSTPLIVRNDSSANNTTKSTGLLFQGVDTVGTGKNTGVVQCGPSDANYVTSFLAFQTRTADALNERMRIDSSGNVGIGTSNPGYRLDIASGDTSAGLGYAMRLRSNATATAATIQFTNSAVSTQNGLIACTDTGGMTIQTDGASSVLAFRTNGNERARVNSSGELLVGTTTGGRTVCISSADNWIRMSNASRSYLIGNSNSSAFNIFDETGGATRFQIAADGTANVFGLLVGRSSASTDVNTANDTGSFSVRGSTTTIASMSFHRTGAYAINMGLGTDNVFRIGGWSASSNAFQMDGSGNLTMLGNVTAYSDARIKKNVETIDSALDLVSKMRGVRYTRIDNDKRGVGVIAQEMLEVCPEVVQQGVGDDDTLSVAYGNLVGVLIEAVKELTARVAELEGK